LQQNSRALKSRKFTNEKSATVKKMPSKEKVSDASYTPAKTADRGKGLQLYIAPDLYKSLKQAALDRDTTIRAVVLAALKNDGFDVKDEDLRDRRT
jgi:hypothetical protein